MDNEKINVLVVEPEKKPYSKEISSGLSSLQYEVGGYIQAVYPYEEPVAIICDEEAKLTGKQLNRALRDEDGKIYDVVAGTFFLCGASPDSSGFTSLEDAQIRRFKRRFRWLELFAQFDGNIVAIPVIEAEEQRRETDE